MSQERNEKGGAGWISPLSDINSYVLFIDDLDRLEEGIKKINYMIEAKYDDIKNNINDAFNLIRQDLKTSYANCFNQGTSGILYNPQSYFEKKCYAFIFDNHLKLQSSLSFWLCCDIKIDLSSLFDETINNYYMIKIHDVCANVPGYTKILMKYLVRDFLIIKWPNSIIWLNVDAFADDRTKKAYNLYLDVGFEFIINSETKFIDMIYNKNNPFLTSNNPDYKNIVDARTKNLINIMFYKNDNFISGLPITNTNVSNDFILSSKQDVVFVSSLKSKLHSTTSDFISNVNEYLQESKEESKESKEIKCPVMSLSYDNTDYFLYLNSLIHNEQFNYNEAEEKINEINRQFNHRGLTNTLILLRTSFASELKYEGFKFNKFIITSDTNHKTKNFSIIKENEYFVYINEYGQKVDIKINNLNDITIIKPTLINDIIYLDNVVKYLNFLNIQMIILDVTDLTITDDYLKYLYFKYNFVLTYQGETKKVYPYNNKRFNNIKYVYFEIDNFSINTLFANPFEPISKQPISIDNLNKIFTCPYTLETYYLNYLEYTKLNIKENKVFFAGYPFHLEFTFFGYILFTCENTVCKQILEYFNILSCSTSKFNQNINYEYVINLSYFITLNFYNMQRSNKYFNNDLIFNLNILKVTKNVNMLQSLSHGEIIQSTQKLLKGQKLLMYTSVNSYFNFGLLSPNFINNIFNNLDRFFYCIDLLIDTKFSKKFIIDNFPNELSAMFSTIANPNSNIVIYTDEYHDHMLTYTNETACWTKDYPLEIDQSYEGSFTLVSPNSIILTGNVSPVLMNSRFSIIGKKINFNIDTNDTNNFVTNFNIIDNTVTFSIPLNQIQQNNATSVLISNPTHTVNPMNLENLYSNFFSNIGINPIDDMKTFFNRNEYKLQHIINRHKQLSTKNYKENDKYLELIKTEFMKETQIDSLYNTVFSQPMETITQFFLKNSFITYNVLSILDYQYIYPIGITSNADNEIQKLLPDLEQNINSPVAKYTTKNTRQYSMKDIISKNNYKYNSFLCCRGASIGSSFPQNNTSLLGEINLRDILIDRFKSSINLTITRNNNNLIFNYIPNIDDPWIDTQIELILVDSQMHQKKIILYKDKLLTEFIRVVDNPFSFYIAFSQSSQSNVYTLKINNLDYNINQIINL